MENMKSAFARERSRECNGVIQGRITTKLRPVSWCCWDQTDQKSTYFTVRQTTEIPVLLNCNKNSRKSIPWKTPKSQSERKSNVPESLWRTSTVEHHPARINHAIQTGDANYRRRFSMRRSITLPIRRSRLISRRFRTVISWFSRFLDCQHFQHLLWNVQFWLKLEIRVAYGMYKCLEYTAMSKWM